MASARFGYGVHRRRDQGNAQLDRPGQAGAGIGLAGQDFGGAGHQKDIVEGQGFADGLAGIGAFAPLGAPSL